jgi:hypothetical protein
LIGDFMGVLSVAMKQLLMLTMTLTLARQHHRGSAFADHRRRASERAAGTLTRRAREAKRCKPRPAIIAMKTLGDHAVAAMTQDAKRLIQIRVTNASTLGDHIVYGPSNDTRDQPSDRRALIENHCEGRSSIAMTTIDMPTRSLDIGRLPKLSSSGPAIQRMTTAKA